MSEFLISKWLANVCFFESGKHGLSKDFYLDQNSKDNFNLLGEVSNSYLIMMIGYDEYFQI